MAETWDPDLYARFREERARPGRELVAGLEPRPGGRAIDLGCGTGELTAALHERLRAASTLGLDSSAAMLERAAAQERPGLAFERRDLRDLDALGPFDVVFSNAALQWVPDHEALLGRLRDALAPGGTLAFQVPANHRHVTHHLAAGLAREEPFASALEGRAREAPVLEPEAYCALLHDLGFSAPRVELRCYLHLLPGPESLVDWVEGTLLTWYRERLPATEWERFLPEYRSRVLARVPQRRPFPFTFPRVLAWAGL